MFLKGETIKDQEAEENFFQTLESNSWKLSFITNILNIPDSVGN